MSIVIACDSFLALRNVRNGNLGHWLAGEQIQVWVDPHQLTGSRFVQPDGVEVGCLEDFDAQRDPEFGRDLKEDLTLLPCFSG